jgi:hypothetical protein
MKTSQLIPVEIIEQRIFFLRKQKILLDKDLASLYGVQTRDLNKAVKRNIERFPDDFMFQLTKEEFQGLMFHFGTSKKGGTRKLPYAFTEQGVAMLSSVLHSSRAIQVNIIIMRVFVKIRQIFIKHKDLELKLMDLENKVEKHDIAIQSIFEVIRQLVTPPEKPKRPIGFRIEEPRPIYRISKKK